MHPFRHWPPCSFLEYSACIIGILLRPFKVPGQNIAYNFALFTLFIISLLGLAMGSVDDLAPIGQPAHPEETSEFGAREY